MEQPPGFVKDGEEDLVCLLVKALYGLKQAGRAWYLDLYAFLTTLGFKRCDADYAVFHRRLGDSLTILGLHVDDSLITGTHLELLIDLENVLNQRYPLKIMGSISFFLGTSITRNREERTISLSQTKYIDEAIARFGLIDALPASTPLPPSLRIGPQFCPKDEEEIASMRNKPYRELIGLLMYIANGTRPDIAYPVNILAQVMINPGRIHWEAAKHIVRYLKGTRDLKLTYGGGSKGFSGFSDASHGSENIKWKSMSGYAFLMDGGAVSWSAKKQSIVALSSAESEYVAITHATKELVSLRYFISEVFSTLRNPTTLYADSQSAIAMAKSDSYSSRTKHIAIRYHYIRKAITHRVVSLTWINTHSNVADLFTKALDVEKTRFFAKGLGLLAA